MRKVISIDPGHSKCGLLLADLEELVVVSGKIVLNISVLELVQKMESVLSKNFKYDVVDHPDSYPADEPQRRCPDITKAQLQLNYKPRVSLEDGLERFFDWAFKNY